MVRVFGRDAETSGRQSHQCPTITAASRCSACSLVVTFVLVSVPLSFLILFELVMWIIVKKKRKKRKECRLSSWLLLLRVFWLWPVQCRVTFRRTVLVFGLFQCLSRLRSVRAHGSSKKSNHTRSVGLAGWIMPSLPALGPTALGMGAQAWFSHQALQTVYDYIRHLRKVRLLLALNARWSHLCCYCAQKHADSVVGLRFRTGAFPDHVGRRPVKWWWNRSNHTLYDVRNLSCSSRDKCVQPVLLACACRSIWSTQSDRASSFRRESTWKQGTFTVGLCPGLQEVSVKDE